MGPQTLAMSERGSATMPPVCGTMRPICGTGKQVLGTTKRLIADSHLRRELTDLTAALTTVLDRLRSHGEAEPSFGDVDMASVIERTLGVITSLGDELDALDDDRITASGVRQRAQRDRARSAGDRQQAADDRGAAQRDRDDEEGDAEQREIQLKSMGLEPREPSSWADAFAGAPGTAPALPNSR